MQIARVVGTVVSTQKNRKFEGAKLLLVQPLNLDDSARGQTILAVDGVGAGVSDKVLLVLEGRAAGEAIGKKLAPVDAAIVGIIDAVDVMEISDEELRGMVRDAIARHGRGGNAPPSPPEPAARPHVHPSHGRLPFVGGGDPDGRCLIEPAVACTHCGFCQSMGH